MSLLRQASRPLSPASEERTRRFALVGLSVVLALAWGTAPGGHGTVLALAGMLSLGALLALRAPWAPALFASVLATTVAFARLPDLPLAYENRLRLEVLASFLPFVTLLLLARAGRPRSHPARVLVGVAVALALLGILVRLGEVWFLFGRTGDATTIRHALRLDLAESLWAAGAWAVAFVHLVGRDRAPATWPRLRSGGAWMGAFVGFTLITSGAPALVESGASPSGGLLVGFHAEQVGDVPEGADIVHLEAAMPTVQPARGVYDFDMLDAQLEGAKARGLQVFLLVSAYPPRWLQQAYPESVMTDADGRPFYWIDEAPGTPAQRVWEMSFADPRVFEARAEFVRTVVDRYADHEAVSWVAVQNEPAYPMDWNLLRWASFDDATVAAFREALRMETDHNLTLLEEEYGVDAESWEDVMPPRVPFGRFGDRWTDWREDLLVSHTKALMQVARQETDKPVTTKLMAHFLTRFAEPQAGLSDSTYRELASASDVVSIDLYPVTRGDLVRQLEYFRALAEDKPIIVAEFNLALGTELPFAGLRMLSALDTISRYADAVILFTASGHFLYGLEEDSAAFEATRLVRLGFRDGAYAPTAEELLRRELIELTQLPVRVRDAGAAASAVSR